MGNGYRGSNRKAGLPSNWARLKRQTHERDGWRCTYVSDDTGERCTYSAVPGAKGVDDRGGRGLECHHVADDKDHSLKKLATLCWYHHGRETGKQGGDNVRKNAATKPGRDKFGRPIKPHPGMKRLA